MMGLQANDRAVLYEDDELASMTGQQRRDLARRLADLEGAPIERTARVQRDRRLFMGLVLIAAVFLIPWTILLAVTLPKNYQTGHWDAAWVGFDAALIVFLAIAAWAAWRRRHVLVFAAIVTATLLITDAWFDILTSSRNDVGVSIATGLLGNLPLAVLFIVVAYRLVRVSTHNARRLAGCEVLDLPLRKLPLYGVDEAET
jgi:hypothetical protein